MTFPRGGAAALMIAVVAGASACGSSAPPDERQTFTAWATDFVGFRAWPSQSVDTAIAAGSTHVSGKRTVYINALPPPGAATFPVGTIIVKETEADGKLFARVKRGGSYNVTGAVGWEWFEIEEIGASMRIVWRGLGPPAGESYGGDPNAGCNVCHRTVPANDYVLSPWLTLTPAPDGGVPEADGGDEGDAGDGGTIEVDANGASDAADVD
jgi:hypothetical protein